MRDLAPLIDRVHGLLDSSSRDPSRPEVDELEHTLTDGYAAALALEGECLRLARQIDEHGGNGVDSSELRGRLRTLEGELGGLRDLLAQLRGRVDLARAGAARPG